MARTYSKKIPEKWIIDPSDPEVQLLIRPSSITKYKSVPTQESPPFEYLLDVFIGGVIDWKGIVDKDTGKPMKCTEETRKSIGYQADDLLVWATVEIRSYTNENDEPKEKEIKN